MTQATSGDRVKVHYTGTLEDGSVFDSSEGFIDRCSDDSGDCADNGCSCGSTPSEPLDFVIGAGTLLPKFETAVIGLAPGQSIRVVIQADEAYGQRADEMVAVISRSDLPEGIDPQVGQQMEVILENGSPLPVLVTETNAASITLDANHPLAGCDLTFDIKLVEIL